MSITVIHMLDHHIETHLPRDVGGHDNIETDDDHGFGLKDDGW